MTKTKRNKHEVKGISVMYSSPAIIHVASATDFMRSHFPQFLTVPSWNPQSQLELVALPPALPALPHKILPPHINHLFFPSSSVR